VLITRLYSGASSRKLLLAAALGCLALAGCWLGRVFDPVQDPGKLIAIEPKFSTLRVGQDQELSASIVGETSQGVDFTFTEDSAGRVLALTVEDGSHARVTAVGAGRATVTASHGDDEGLAVVTVQTQR